VLIVYPGNYIFVQIFKQTRSVPMLKGGGRVFNRVEEGPLQRHAGNVYHRLRQFTDGRSQTMGGRIIVFLT
jgi:hypothetical protein